MNASVGDRVIISSNVLDRPVRDGEIVELRRADGRRRAAARTGT